MLPRSGISRHFSEILTWRPPLKKGLATIRTLLLLPVFFIAVFIASSWIDTSKFRFQFQVESSTNKTMTIYQTHPRKIDADKSTNKSILISGRHQTLLSQVEFPLNCTIENQNQTCPTNYPKTSQTQDQDPSSTPSCPNYFQWIHEDLKPWSTTGITRDMVERARGTAHFRLVIVNGKVYIQNYRKSIQSRDKFTIWGILQLLRRYPGKLPDLELMFDCDDQPVIQSSDYQAPNNTGPPPLFRYCGNNRTMDIVFPDWSFWGWAEINIKPWNSLLKEIKEGNNRTKWIDRVPYAYWKGNPFVADRRKELLSCNVSKEHDWNARIFIQDWILESQQGFRQSNLANQCTHRYKIYIEGYAWSVSEKYILACNSVTFFVKPHYHDFFTRSLQPLEHYWPIRDNDKCKSIKFAVDWCNKHKQKAQAIGKAASDFMQEEVKMEYVYDYMFHLLNGYAKLLKFEPRIPEGAVELCSEMMACSAHGFLGLEKKFMMESLVKSPSITGPCTMPPTYDPQVLSGFYRRNLNIIKQVEKWENGYWESLQQKRLEAQKVL